MGLGKGPIPEAWPIWPETGLFRAFLALPVGSPWEWLIALFGPEPGRDDGSWG